MSSTTTTGTAPKTPTPQINTSASPTTMVNDDNLTSALTTSPQSPGEQRTRERGMSVTASWKPVVSDRRQSFSAEEYKHEQHQRLGSRDHEVRTGGVLGGEQGFTEEPEET